MFENRVLRSSSDIRKLKSRWMKWAGHVAHLREKSI
jgi:hypothetical protein